MAIMSAHPMEKVTSVEIDGSDVEVIFIGDENKREFRLVIDKKHTQFISKEEFDVYKDDNEALKAMVKKLLSDSK